MPHDAIINAMEEYAAQFKTEWISVKDRLPKVLQSVLVSLSNKKQTGELVHSGIFWHKKFCIDGDNSISQKLSKDVTHWMPLPEPPKQEGGK
jgi:hypothetical protein